MAPLWAPRGTAPEIIDRLNREIIAALATGAIKSRIAELGAALAGSPRDFGELFARDGAKWARVIRAANIKPE